MGRDGSIVRRSVLRGAINEIEVSGIAQTIGGGRIERENTYGATGISAFLFLIGSDMAGRRLDEKNRRGCDGDKERRRGRRKEFGWATESGIDLVRVSVLGSKAVRRGDC